MQVHGQLRTRAAAFGFAVHHETVLVRTPPNEKGQMPVYGLGSSRRSTSEAGVAASVRLPLALI